MEEGQYVNKNDARYASSETCEKALLAKFMKIKQNTKIDSLYNETNKYKYYFQDFNNKNKLKLYVGKNCNMCGIY